MTGDDPELAAIVARVAAAWEVPARDLRAGRKGSRRAVQARQVAIYLAVVGLERTRKGVAPFFRRHPSVVGHAVRVVEDLRDDPEFDAALAELEALLAQGSGVGSSISAAAPPRCSSSPTPP